MAEGGRVGKSWRVREAMGDKVPEAKTTACACSTNLHAQTTFSCQPDVSLHASILNVCTTKLKRRGGGKTNTTKKRD